MNDFASDDAWQRDMRDRILVPGFYEVRALHGHRYVFMDKGRCARLLQKRLAVDTVMQTRANGTVCIEEKIVRWPEKKGEPHTAFFLETESCTVPGYESPGWMTYAEADYLLYCFEQQDGGLDCYLIDFPKLRKWFWERDTTFPYSRQPEKNQTAGRVVPIKVVRAAVPTWRVKIPPPALPEPPSVEVEDAAGPFVEDEPPRPSHHATQQLDLFGEAAA